MTEAEESADDEPSLDLVARVAAHDEELGAAVADLADRIETLEEQIEERADEVETLEETLEEKEDEIEELTERLQRTRADFQNYKKRAKKRQEQIEERATEDLVERLLDVRDNLTRALEEESEDIESLREGIRMTRSEFDRVLDAENVSRIDPDPGVPVDPNRHEVMMRVESEQPADTVAEVYRPGYEMAGKVLRTAQVTVSEGPDERATDDETVQETGAGDEGETAQETANDSDPDAAS